MALLDSEEKIKERNKLVEDNLYFAIFFVKRFLGDDFMFNEDIVQAAKLGLIDAAEKYKPELGYKFITYAAHWMRARVMKEFCRRPIITRSLSFKIREKYKSIKIEFSTCLSLLNELKSEIDCFYADSSNPEIKLILTEEFQDILNYFENLENNFPDDYSGKEKFKRDVKLFKSYYGINNEIFEFKRHTFVEIAEKFGISRDTVRFAVKSILKIVLRDLKEHSLFGIIKIIFENGKADAKRNGKKARIK